MQQNVPSSKTFVEEPGGQMESTRERRRVPRFNLHCIVRFLGSEDELDMIAETRDVSISGLFCRAPSRLVPRARVTCILEFPTHNCGLEWAGLRLRCKAEVVRVEPPDSERQFGIACRIDQYSVLPVAEPA